MSHIFVSGEIASGVWYFFQKRIGISNDSPCIRSHCFSSWILRARNKFARWVFTLVPLLIFWNLWKNRNAARFGSRSLMVKQVCDSTSEKICLIFRATFPQVQFHGGCWDKLLC